jgi:hypothetical protein
LNRLLSITTFKHPFFIQRKISNKNLSVNDLNTYKKKRKKRRISSVSWILQKKFNKNRFYKNTKNLLKLSTLDDRTKSEWQNKWINFYSKFKKGMLENMIYIKKSSKINKKKKNKILYNKKNIIKKIPLYMPISQDLKARIQYPKSKRFLPLSDILLMESHNSINIFISYSKPTTVYYFRYFLSFYKHILKTKTLYKRLLDFQSYNNTKLATHCLKKNMDIFCNSPTDLLFNNFYKTTFNLSTIIENAVFNKKFVLYLKNNLQKYFNTEVNLFFFNNSMYSIYNINTMQELLLNRENIILLNKTKELQQRTTKIINKYNINLSEKLKLLYSFKNIYKDFVGLKFINLALKFKKKTKAPMLTNRMTLSMFLIAIQQALLTGSTKAVLDLVLFQFKRARNQARFYYYLKTLMILFFEKFNAVPRYLNGIRIIVTGRLNGRNRSKKRIISLGSTALINKSKILDFSKGQVTTRYGVIGVKIYFFFN